MKKFYIDMAYVTSVLVRKEYKIAQGTNESSEDFLVRILKSDYIVAYSVSSEDHDEFTKLRNQLENEGYVKTVRNYWNGDRVLKRFYLNDVLFKEGEQFLSSDAIKYKLENK